MLSLSDKITNTVQEQTHPIAVTNCFSMWDDEINLEVIVQGIHDRLKALGSPIEALELKKTGLNMIKILNPEGEVMIEVLHLSSSNTYCFGGAKKDMFNRSELTLMGKWLMENFHH